MKPLCVSLLLVAAVACSDRQASVASPSAPSASSTLARFSIGGRVVSSRTLTPIADASVSIVAGPDAGRSTTTGASGYFAFGELEQSTALVEVSAPEYASRQAVLSANQFLGIILAPPP